MDPGSSVSEMPPGGDQTNLSNETQTAGSAQLAGQQLTRDLDFINRLPNELLHRIFVYAAASDQGLPRDDLTYGCTARSNRIDPVQLVNIALGSKRFNDVAQRIRYKDIRITPSKETLIQVASNFDRDNHMASLVRRICLHGLSRAISNRILYHVSDNNSVPDGVKNLQRRFGLPGEATTRELSVRLALILVHMTPNVVDLCLEMPTGEAYKVLHEIAHLPDLPCLRQLSLKDDSGSGYTAESDPQDSLVTIGHFLYKAPNLEVLIVSGVEATMPSTRQTPFSLNLKTLKLKGCVIQPVTLCEILRSCSHLAHFSMSNPTRGRWAGAEEQSYIRHTSGMVLRSLKNAGNTLHEMFIVDLRLTDPVREGFDAKDFAAFRVLDNLTINVNMLANSLEEEDTLVDLIKNCPTLRSIRLHEVDVPPPQAALKKLAYQVAPSEKRYQLETLNLVSRHELVQGWGLVNFEWKLLKGLALWANQEGLVGTEVKIFARPLIRIPEMNEEKLSEDRFNMFFLSSAGKQLRGKVPGWRSLALTLAQHYFDGSTERYEMALDGNEVQDSGSEAEDEFL
ncbi:hypothetical protein OQA88_5764 [Cercophora sp. LCS_1]